MALVQGDMHLAQKQVRRIEMNKIGAALAGMRKLVLADRECILLVDKLLT